MNDDWEAGTTPPVHSLIGSHRVQRNYYCLVEPSGVHLGLGSVVVVFKKFNFVLFFLINYIYCMNNHPLIKGFCWGRGF